jgi:hypothetical protein
MVKRAAVAFVALMLCAPAAAYAQNAGAPPAPPRDSAMDLTAGVSMIRDSDHHAFAGVRGTGALNLTESCAAIVQVEWLVAIAERTASGRVIRDNQTTALAGLRLRKFVESLAVPYLQVTAGYANRLDNGLESRRSLFAFRADGGLEMSVSRHFAVRAGGGWTYFFADVPYRHQFGGTIGVTLSLGER